MSPAGTTEGAGATAGVICAATASGDSRRRGKNWTTQAQLSISLTLLSNVEESTAHGEDVGGVASPRRAISRSSQVCPEPEQGNETDDDQTFGVLLSEHCQEDLFSDALVRASAFMSFAYTFVLAIRYGIGLSKTLPDSSEGLYV
jgi:hypothetical protein